MAQKKKSKRKGHIYGLVFWLCLIILIAPFAVLGWVIYSAMQDQGVPVIGNRYEGDLDPAITRTQLEQVEAAVKKVEGVESAFVSMPTATLRVYADVNDDATAETINVKTDELFNAVASVLNPAVYFKQTETKKMYDLEIHVYNFVKEPETRKYEEIVADTTDDGFVYMIETLNSGMEIPLKSLVSEPKDAELAKSLRESAAAREAKANQPSEAPAEGGEVEINDQDETEGSEDIDTGEEGGEVDNSEPDTGQGD